MLLVLVKFGFGSLFDHQHHVWIQIQIIELRLIILSFDVNLSRGLQYVRYVLSPSDSFLYKRPLCYRTLVHS